MLAGAARCAGDVGCLCGGLRHACNDMLLAQNLSRHNHRLAAACFCSSGCRHGPFVACPATCPCACQLAPCKCLPGSFSAPICSGQMILAQGLQRHLLGPDWRWPDAAPAGGSGAEAAPPPELARLLQLFWDTPAGKPPAYSLPGIEPPARGQLHALLAPMLLLLLLHVHRCPAAGHSFCLGPCPASRRSQRLFPAQPVRARPHGRRGARALAGALGGVQGVGGHCPRGAAGRPLPLVPQQPGPPQGAYWGAPCAVTVARHAGQACCRQDKHLPSPTAHAQQLLLPVSPPQLIPTPNLCSITRTWA